MGSILEVNQDNYVTEVVQQSYEKPILVDFFATWCGPCQVLKPMLEKLAKEYDFVLAKVDIDRNPDLANQFNIEGVPDVRIVRNGEMMPGFVGVLPEAQLRDLLGQLNLQSELDLELQEVRNAITSSNPQKAKDLFDRLFEKYPNNSQITLEAAQFLIQMQQFDAAEKMLDTITPDNQEFYPQAKALKILTQLQQEAQQTGESELDDLFRQGVTLTQTGDYEAALPMFLEIVQRDRTYKNDLARKAMLTLFELLGKTHPVTKDYQKQLMLALY